MKRRLQQIQRFIWKLQDEPWWPEQKVLRGYLTTGLMFVAVHLGLGADAPLVVYGVPVIVGAVVSWLTKPSPTDLWRRTGRFYKI